MIEKMRKILPKGSFLRIMDPLECAMGRFKVQDTSGEERTWVSFAVEIAFPIPTGKDGPRKLEQIQEKIENYVKQTTPDHR